MNELPLKEKLKKEIHESIVAAGTVAFAEYGYHGMSIAKVAREAGVANGTYYLHFKDKAALYSEITARAAATLAAQLFTARNYGLRQGGNSERAEIDAVIEFAISNPSLLKIALDVSAPSSQSGQELLRPLIDMRLTDIKKGVKEGHIQSGIHPEIAARAEIGMMLSVVYWWTCNPNKATKDQVVTTLTQLRKSWAATDTNVDDIDTLLSEWDSRI